MTRRSAELGHIDPQLADEFPGLALICLRLDARKGRTPAPIKRRMRELAGRISGATVVQARQDEVPWAYRVLWRRLGLDPDSDRTPVERLMVERLEHGGIPSHGMPNDAIVLATLETGIPVVVVDASKVGERPGLRPARSGESVDNDTPLRPGEVVYADDDRPLARLTGEVAPVCAVDGDTTEMLVCALAAASVSQMAIDEALWMVADLLEATGRLEESTREDNP